MGGYSLNSIRGESEKRRRRGGAGRRGVLSNCKVNLNAIVAGQQTGQQTGQQRRPLLASTFRRPSTVQDSRKCNVRKPILRPLGRPRRCPQDLSQLVHLQDVTPRTCNTRTFTRRSVGCSFSFIRHPTSRQIHSAPVHEEKASPKDYAFVEIQDFVVVQLCKEFVSLRCKAQEV